MNAWQDSIQTEEPLDRYADLTKRLKSHRNKMHRTSTVKGRLEYTQKEIKLLKAMQAILKNREPSVENTKVLVDLNRQAQTALENLEKIT